MKKEEKKKKRKGKRIKWKFYWNEKSYNDMEMLSHE